LDITLETQKFRIRNPLNQELHFCIENTLKLTYKHLEVKKIFRGLRPLDPQEGEGKGRVGRGGANRTGEGRGGRRKRGEGREGKGRGEGGQGRRGGQGRNVAPPSKNSLKKALCHSYSSVFQSQYHTNIIFSNVTSFTFLPYSTHVSLYSNPSVW
jgi:hypothetical protein